MRHTASHLMEVRLCRQSLQLLESHSLDESPPQLQRMLGVAVHSVHLLQTPGPLCLLAKLDLDFQSFRSLYDSSKWWAQEKSARFGSSRRHSHIVASCAIVPDLRAHLKGISSSQATVPIPPLSFSFFKIRSRCWIASWERAPAPPSLCFFKTGGRETDTGSNLSSCDPVCAGGTHAFLGFRFVVHSHKTVLGLWALVTYIVFPPTPDKETTLQRFFISSHNYARSNLSPDPLSHIPLSGSTYQIPANRETIHVDYNMDTSLESFVMYNLCDQRP